ncbi:energy-coupling factor transporter transmembrane protein EcfT [Schaalia sp. 19OD2882]|uniref:energy-coupling factor transporter transmembrane component T n=1 Tax=Schaalia sp. 19OD2882 TaxID=2794089 RepID=UPI001C1F1A64|nr:energy-coupling factor transporter transmembrane component T [Schaalia sp. 19OD2882]QWW19400.1 energy-coupling factor transporter transmembrane protein EcfT [Schaalia sp. 19OD2882]
MTATAAQTAAPTANPLTFRREDARRPIRIHADPRSRVLLVVLVNALVLSLGPTSVLILSAATAVILLADALAAKHWVPYALAVTTMLVGCVLVPHVWSTPAGLGVAVIAQWFARFATSLGMATWLVSSTTSGEFLAGLRSLRVPGLIVLPVAVVLRFIPSIIRELRAIIDAMRLRGVFPTLGSVLLNPVATAEHVLVPLLAMTTRMADELSAAALIRGLDRSGPRTSVVKLGFGPWDLLVLAFALLLVALAWSGWEFPWTIH